MKKSSDLESTDNVHQSTSSNHKTEDAEKVRQGVITEQLQNQYG